MGGFGIANVESLDDLAELLASMPMAGLGAVKVYPLVDPDVTIKLVEASLQALSKIGNGWLSNPQNTSQKPLTDYICAQEKGALYHFRPFTSR